MTKLSVLLIFSSVKGFLTPDQVRGKLHPSPDRRSLYSYLDRLRRQGLLERGHNLRRGQLSYRLTQRGAGRIKYLQSRKAPSEAAAFNPAGPVQEPAALFRRKYY